MSWLNSWWMLLKDSCSWYSYFVVKVYRMHSYSKRFTECSRNNLTKMLSRPSGKKNAFQSTQLKEIGEESDLLYRHSCVAKQWGFELSHFLSCDARTHLLSLQFKKNDEREVVLPKNLEYQSWAFEKTPEIQLKWWWLLMLRLTRWREGVLCRGWGLILEGSLSQRRCSLAFGKPSNHYKSEISWFREPAKIWSCLREASESLLGTGIFNEQPKI